jgi:PAS domain S-box-containing protein
MLVSNAAESREERMHQHCRGDKNLEWLVRSASDPVLILGQDGLIILANAGAAALFDYSEPALVGMSVEDLIPERLRQRHAQLRAGYFSNPLARPMGSGLELFARNRDGHEIPVEISLSPMQVDAHTSLVMITIHDISRRKEAERALQASEARMRAIFETAVDAIVTIDERGILERFNPAAERLFGYREEEIAGKNVSMLMPSPYREMHDAYLARYRDTGERRIIGSGRQVIGRRKDGSVFPMDLAVAEMRVGDKRMFTGIVRDISERKHAEQQQARMLQEIRSANDELTSFAYVVSHDLKAPLRGIASLADWLSTDYADRFDDAGKEQMQLLINRVHRMSNLIDGILQYSRIGRLKETVTAVDLNRLVLDIIDLLAPPPHIKVRVEDALPVLYAEPTRLQQVFQNLLSNAIKYMDKPCGDIRVSCRAEERHWRFSVTDNGPGIEERHFERIFQLFQTLAPRDRVESTGVGLALVKKIVEMYGGKVSVTSVPGNGSRFSFTLPKDPRDPLSR